MKTKTGVGRSNGVVASDVMIVVATITLIGLVLLPAVIRPERRVSHARISCVNNLKTVGLALRIYANDHEDRYPMQISEAEGGAKESAERGEVFRVFQVMSNELSVPKSVQCRADTRVAATNFENFNNTHVSYFVGIDALDTKPNMILAGDRNLAIDGTLLSGVHSLSTNLQPEWTSSMHDHVGNIGLADGSVQQVTSETLRQQLKETGDTNNRVAFPQ